MVRFSVLTILAVVAVSPHHQTHAFQVARPRQSSSLASSSLASRTTRSGVRHKAVAVETTDVSLKIPNPPIPGDEEEEQTTGAMVDLSGVVLSVCSEECVFS